MLTAFQLQCGGAEYNGTTCCAAGNKCVKLTDYYSQCQPDPSVCASFLFLQDTAANAIQASTASGGGGPAYTPTGPTAYTTTLAVSTTSHAQSPYPTPTGTGSGCGSWQLTEGVCCPLYDNTNNKSESCSGSGGNCVTPPAAMCKSGTMYPEVHSVGKDEPWHYSVSAVPTLTVV